MPSNTKPNEKMRAAMVLAGYTQEKMAKAMGLSFSAFNLKINGRREFTISECNRAAHKLGKTLDEIFFENDVPKREQKKNKRLPA